MEKSEKNVQNIDFFFYKFLQTSAIFTVNGDNNHTFLSPKR